MEKDFNKWNEIKQKINSKDFIPPKVKEMEFWQIRVGLNIDNEINGKGENYTRPCLILKKFSRKKFLIIPGTTTKRPSNISVEINFTDNTTGYYSIDQLKTVSYKRLHNKHKYKTVNNDYIIKIKEMIRNNLV